MIEAEDRGWYESDGYVCPDCVEDEFLKSVISDKACHQSCDYCGKASDYDFASPVEPGNGWNGSLPRYGPYSLSKR